MRAGFHCLTPRTVSLGFRLVQFTDFAKLRDLAERSPSLSKSMAADTRFWLVRSQLLEDNKIRRTGP